jgi:pimeloyl-ACP methyl ester carboxylesterase
MMPIKRHPNMIFFPGLGADERLFAPQRAAFPGLLVPPWIPPRKREGLAGYAARMAETLPREEPLVLGGVSLGGMIAYEVAQHLRPQAVILIASCRTREGLRLLYRAGGVLWPSVPKQVFRIAQFSAKSALRLFGRVPAKEQKMLVDMFREMDPAFMHWAVAAILRWNPPPLADIPVFQIHGRRDRMIPARRVKPDLWIPDGGHLINITHAEEVNAFIRAAMQRIAAERT